MSIFKLRAQRYKEIFFSELINKSFQALLFKILGTFFAFLLSLKLANILDPEDMGLYFLALMVLTIGSVLSRIGMENVLLRLIAENKAAEKFGDLKGVFKSGIMMSFFVAFLLTVIIYIAAPLLSSLFNTSSLEQDIRIMVLGIIPFTFIALISASLKGLHHIALAQMVESLFIPLVAFFLVYFFVEKSELAKIEVFYVCSLVITSIIAFFLWKKVTRSFTEKVIPCSKRLLISCGRPLLLVSSFNLIMVWTGTVALGIFSDVGEVAIYNIATRVAVLTSFILIAVNSASSAKFAVLYKENRMKELQQMGFRSTLLITFFSMPILVVFFVFPNFIISLFGSAYAESALILSILAIGQLFTVLTGSIGQILAMTGHGEALRNAVFYGVVVQCVLVFFLVPQFGAVGAAISASLCSIVVNVLAAIYVRRLLAIKTTLIGV